MHDFRRIRGYGALRYRRSPGQPPFPVTPGWYTPLGMPHPARIAIDNATYRVGSQIGVCGLVSRSSPAVGWALSLQTTSRDLNYQEVFASYPALLNYIAAGIDYSGRTVGSELAEFTDNVGAYNPDPVLDSSDLIHSPGLPNQVRFGAPRRQSVVCRDEDD